MTPEQRQSARRDLGFDGFVAGYIGRLVPEKGLTDLIDALSLCPPDMKAILVGSGPSREELECRAAGLGLTDRVVFMGTRPLTELPRIMGAIDALVLPSRTTPQWKEQFGRVIIEAHACDTPVVGSDSGAIPSVIGSGGLVYPEGNPKALAEALRRLYDEPVEAGRLGAIGREQVDRQYTCQRVAERMGTIYANMLGGNTPTESSRNLHPLHSENA